jgi:hypothetical protein
VTLEFFVLIVVFHSFFQTVAEFLTASNLRGQVFGGIWPLVTDARVEEMLDKAIVKQGINLLYKPLIRNLDDTRRQIRQQLTEMENSQITEIAESLQKAFNISAGTISRTAITSYLANTHPKAEDALLHEIVSGNSVFYFRSNEKYW